MSKRDLIEAYVGGRLPRREFVRGLTALGVSAGAALAYAQQLGPTTAAAPGRGPAGFVVRAQAADEEYGTACVLASDGAGAAAALGALLNVQAALDAGLAAYAGELPNLDALGLSAADALQTASAQVQEQVAALQTLVADLGGTAPPAPSPPTFTDVAGFLSALAEGLNAAASLLAGVAPAVQDPEARQTLTSIAVASGKNAGFANALNGNPASDAALQQPTCP